MTVIARLFLSIHARKEPSTAENGNSENHEHQPERYDATSRAEACRSDQV